VHVPVDTPEEYKRPYEKVKFDADPLRDESLHRFAAFVTQLDTKVGDFIRSLEETDQRRNTLVLFTSDNGGQPSAMNPYVGKVPSSPALSSNDPLRGQKDQLYEGGIRVCAFANWPGKLKPGKLDAPLHAVDWMPTLTKLAGWQRPAELKQDGIDAWPLLTQEAAKPESRIIYIAHRSGAVVLEDGWKLIKPSKADGKPELYHVAADPSEKKDLASSEPQRLERLLALLREVRRDDLTQLPADLEGIPN
jgi:arylsulfatase A-like enzyme